VKPGHYFHCEFSIGVQQLRVSIGASLLLCACCDLIQHLAGSAGAVCTLQVCLHALMSVNSVQLRVPLMQSLHVHRVEWQTVLAMYVASLVLVALIGM
jgi:hypothetical protein